ncbi:MAG: ATP-dependent DNA helicase [Phycisphaerales bacterium JB043]
MPSLVEAKVEHRYLLDQQQQAAVDHDTGPLAVLAGPGAGKTRVIVQRIVRMCRQGIDPDRIVALAFTIKSAEELRERLIAQLDPSVVERLFVGTSHSFGRRILTRFADVVGVDPAARVADSAQCKRLLRELITSHDLLQSRAAHGRFSLIPDVLAFAERCRNDDVTPQRAAQWIEDRRARLDSGDHDLDDASLAAERAQLPLDDDVVRLFDLFERQRLERGMLLLDDMLALPLRILQESEHARAILHAEHRHLVVDEFQDWNPAQINLLSHLAPPTSPSGAPADVCVVGDDDQSIYAFRGADDRAFERFSSLYPSATVITLTTNYRSDPAIVDATQHTITQAHHRFRDDKVLRAANDHDPSACIECVTYPRAADDAPTIVAHLLHDKAQRDLPWSSYAVLVRTNTTRDRVLDACDLHAIPTTTRRTPTPLEDAAVQDLLAWCRLLTDPSRTHDLERVLLRPPIGAPIETVRQWRSQWRDDSPADESMLAWLLRRHADHPIARQLASIHDPLAASAVSASAPSTIRQIIRRANLAHAEILSPREHTTRVEALIQVATCVDSMHHALPEPGDLRALLSHYDDLSDHEKQFTILNESALDPTEADDDTDAVTVLTAHSAKGLEFDTVYVVGVHPQAKGSFPSTQKPDEAMVELDRALTSRPEHDHIDEERRLFYVACTRAEKRLVLLARRKKNRGRSTDFLYEIMDDAPVETTESHAEDILARAGISHTTEQALRQQQASARWLHEEIAGASNRASSLIHRATTPDLPDADLTAVRTELDDTLVRLNALAALESTGAIPDSARAHERVGPSLVALAERLHRQEQGSKLFKPMKPPLELSFTKLRAFENCPRCFYARHVLGFREEPSPAMGVGTIAHAAIERFLRARATAEADGQIPPDAGLLISLGRDMCLADPLLRRADDRDELRNQVLSLLHHYADHFHDDDAEILIIEGTTPDRSSTMRAFPYEHNGHTHRIEAKPDRVERMSNGHFRIADYKTGHASKKLLTPTPDDLQLAIYAMGVQHHLEMDEPPLGVAEYWLLRERTIGTLDLDTIKWDKVHATINGAIDDMLAGTFTQGKNCAGLCLILVGD